MLILFELGESFDHLNYDSPRSDPKPNSSRINASSSSSSEATSSFLPSSSSMNKPNEKQS